jgi:hypothetical protein
MALLAVLFFIAIRGGLALLNGPILGEPVPHFPLYLAEALLVEAVALLIVPRERPYAFGAAAGLAIGTIGFAAEYAWSHLWMPLPWQPALIGEALIPAILAAVGAGLLGAFIASAWRAPLDERPARPLRGGLALAGLAAIVAVVGFGLQTSPQGGVTASVSLREVAPAPERAVEATVRIDPPSAAVDANWLNATAWQGGALHLDALEAVDADAGVYRTTEPLPVHGNWKSLIRLHGGDSITGSPIFMPADEAIPAPAVPARASFEREFVADTEILQREQLDGVPGWTKLAGYAVVGGIVAVIIALLGWILTRVARAYGAPSDPPRRSERTLRGRVGPSLGGRA